MLKTKDGRIIDVEECTLEDVSAVIKRVRPSFAKIIKSCDSPDFKFYKVSYPFGSKIINGEKCYLPLADGDSIEFNNPLLPDSLANELSYDPTSEDPLGLILSKSSEFYLPTGGRIVSHAIIHPGEMFGIPRAIDKFQDIQPSKSSMMWNLNSGARSLFTLSKVGAKHRYTRLQKSHGIKIQPVMAQNDEQWPIFTEIAKQAKSKWKMEVLYFSRAWIKQLKSSEWAEISNYLMQLHRASYNIWHNTALIWEAAFNDIEQKNHLNYYSKYTVSTARQLFFIAANSALGFRPSTNDESAPISLLQDVYANGYGLTEDDQSNVIMEPSSFNLANSDSVYYSLNYPTLAQYNPETFKGKSLITLLDEVANVTTKYQQSILTSKPNYVKSLYDVATSAEFSFYHCNDDPQNYKSILNNKIIKDEDLRFTKNQSGEFPEHSSFFKGCIKISRADTPDKKSLK